MCGRYTLAQPSQAIAQHMGLHIELSDLPTLAPHYNIAPTQLVAAVITAPEDHTRQLRRLQWGLVPSWAKDAKMGARMINARSETAAEKPSFRTALKRRRCLIPADGFYEWARSPKGKQPYYFFMQDADARSDSGDRPLFAFAGLWEHWENGNGDAIDSCTILTTSANALLSTLHDRMPVILHPQDYDLWLDPQMQHPDRVQALLCPFPPEAMGHYPVSPVVNNARHDAPDCIQPLLDLA